MCKTTWSPRHGREHEAEFELGEVQLPRTQVTAAVQDQLLRGAVEHDHGLAEDVRLVDDLLEIVGDYIGTTNGDAEYVVWVGGLTDSACLFDVFPSPVCPLRLIPPSCK